MAKAHVEVHTIGQAVEMLDYGYDTVLLNDATYVSVIENNDWEEQ